MRRLLGKTAGVLLAGMIALGGCQNAADSGKSGDTLATEEIKAKNVSYGISCHDPQIIYANGKYYMCGSHQVLAVSKDFSSWEYIANGNKMFSNIFSGDLEAFKFVGQNEGGGYSIWASNIFYNEVMRKYIMYFCTSATYIRSSLCMATSDTPEGPYKFEKAFLHSGFEESEVDQTNLREIVGADADLSKYFQYGGYNNKKWPNCIDPAVFVDEDDRQWMVYGSWSGGLFMLELDPATGLPIHPKEDQNKGVDAYFGYHLIGGEHHPVEGPYIDYNKDTGYYYLFASYGELKRDGGYQIRQFRSKSPTGPYVDYAGKTLADEDDFYHYGIKMAGNYKFPSLETAYMAPGGQSTFVGADKERYITYHQRFDGGTEYHEPRVHRLFMNADGWYVMAPFETGSEREDQEGYDNDALEGDWYLLDHGLACDAAIEEAALCTFHQGGINGLDEEIRYEADEGTNNIRLTRGDVKYTGVIFDMNDEAGNKVRCISASGEDNHTIWAVRYMK